MKRIRFLMAVFVCVVMTLSVFSTVMADEQCIENDVVVSQEIVEIETSGKATVDDFTVEEGVGFVYVALKASGQEAKATKQSKEAKEAKNTEGKIYVYGKIILENGVVTEVVMDQGKDSPDKQGDGDFKKNSPMQDEVLYIVDGNEIEFHMSAAGSDQDGFTIYYKDTKAPETEIINSPSGSISQKDFEINLRSNECGATFMYSLNSGEYVAIEGSVINLAGLEEGDHELVVKAVDAAGNEDGTPAEAGWEVDTIAPDTTVLDPIIIDGQYVTINFASTESEHSYRIDGGEWSEWNPESIAVFESLDYGEHIFEVTSIDEAGNQDPTPAVYIFTIERLDMSLEFVTDFKFEWANDAQRTCHSLATITTDGSAPTEFYCGGGHYRTSYLLYRMDAEGNVLKARIHNTYPEAIDYDPYRNILWTGEPYKYNGAAIYEVDPVTLKTKWAHGGTGPVIGLAVMDENNLVYVNTNGSVILWDLKIGSRTPLFPHGTLAQNCGFDDDVASLDIVGEKIYWTPHSRNRDYVCVTDLEGNHLMNMDLGKTGIGMGTINHHPEYAGELDSFYLATYNSGDTAHWEQYIVV